MTVFIAEEGKKMEEEFFLTSSELLLEKGLQSWPLTKRGKTAVGLADLPGYCSIFFIRGFNCDYCILFPTVY